MKWYLISIFFGMKVFALDIAPASLYRATKEACSKVKLEDLRNLNADKLRAGYFPSQEFTQIHNLIRSESTKSATLEINITEQISITRYILAEPEFHRALNECYPRSPHMVKFFEESILRSDRAGKIVGTVAFLIAFKSAGRLFNAIQKWSQMSYSVLLSGSRGLEALMLSSFLAGDAAKTEQPIDWKSAAKNQAIAAADTLRMEMSLNKQIQDQRDKIENCLNCPEKQEYLLNIQLLQNILASVRKSTNRQ